MINRHRVIVAILAAFLMGALFGYALARALAPVAVCHAPTEDSAPTDCVYDHGGWHHE